MAARTPWTLASCSQLSIFHRAHPRSGKNLAESGTGVDRAAAGRAKMLADSASADGA
jgi:hypothetical protein